MVAAGHTSRPRHGEFSHGWLRSALMFVAASARGRGPWVPAWCLCALSLLGGACFGDNPQFEAGDVGETGDPCSEGWLDCDGEPGCEVPVDDPAHCGSCENSCEVAGQLLGCEAGVCAGVVSLPALEDAYVNDAEPDRNYADEPLLEVDQGPDDLHTFVAMPDLSVVPPEAELLGAELYLSCLDDGDTVKLYRVTEAWSAADLTWNEQPAYEAAPSLTFDPPANPVQLDLSSLVGDWLDGDENHGIALLPTGADGSQFAALDSENGPRLLLELRW